MRDFTGLAIRAGIFAVAALGCGDNIHPAKTDASGGPLTDAPGSSQDGGGGGDACTAANTCGGTCTDLMTDPNNCGMCGHVCGCGSTTCTAGLCDAATLAGDQWAPYQIAVSGSNAYWGDDGATAHANVMTAPIGGGSATVQFAGLTAVRGFAFDGGDMYLTRFEFNVVEFGPLTGANVQNFTDEEEQGADGMTSDATTLYWTDYAAGTVHSKAFTLGLPDGTVVASGQSHPAGIAVDSTSIYWTENEAGGSIMKIAKVLGTANSIATGQASPNQIVLDAAGDVFWTNDGTSGSANSGQLMELPAGTTTPVQIATGSPDHLAVDANNLYWTDLGGTVNRLPLAGSNAMPIVVVQGENEPVGLAVTASCMYFTDYAAGAEGSGTVRSHDLE